MTQQEIDNGNVAIALFMGATVRHIDHPDYSPTGFDVYDLPIGTFEKGFLKYHTSYDWFVPVWNKAVEEFDSISMDDCPENLHESAYGIAYRIRHLPYYFTIESRYPILLQIIEFLNSQKPNAN